MAEVVIESVGSPSEKKASKVYIVLIVIAVIIAILVASFIFINNISMEKKNGIKDCGGDIHCLAGSVENGTSAKAMFTTIIDIFGMKQTSVNYMEFRSCVSNQCSFYISYVNASAEYPAGTPQSIIDTSDQVYESLKGRNGTCILKKSDLVSMLNKWESGSFSTNDFNVSQCQGSYFEWSEISQDDQDDSIEDDFQGNVAACSESWICYNWSSCINNTQSRSCIDYNNCGTIVDKPITNQSCTPGTSKQYGKFSISSNIVGATVKINNTVSGTTAYLGSSSYSIYLSNDLELGNYSIELLKTGCTSNKSYYQNLPDRIFALTLNLECRQSTCAEMGGVICLNSTICSTALFTTSDTANCCSNYNGSYCITTSPGSCNSSTARITADRYMQTSESWKNFTNITFYKTSPSETYTTIYYCANKNGSTYPYGLSVSVKLNSTQQCYVNSAGYGTINRCSDLLYWS